MSSIPTAVRLTVNVRSCGRCERCAGLGDELHHRTPRGMGGGDGREHTVPNLVRLCRTCHRWATVEPSQAIRAGWVVPHANGDSVGAAAPLALLNQVWVRLTDDGVYRIGVLEVRDLAQVQDLLATVRGQRVVPANPLGTLQSPIPAPRVVEKGPHRTDHFGRLDPPVPGSRIPAGSFGYLGEDLAEFAAYLLDSPKPVDRVGDVVE